MQPPPTCMTGEAPPPHSWNPCADIVSDAGTLHLHRVMHDSCHTSFLLVQPLRTRCPNPSAPAVLPVFTLADCWCCSPPGRFAIPGHGIASGGYGPWRFCHPLLEASWGGIAELQIVHHRGRTQR